MSQKVKLQRHEVKSIALEQYGLTVHSLKKMRGIYRLSTKEGSYSFKNAAEMPDFPLIAGVLQKIRDNGFPFVPQLLPTRTGKTHVHYKRQTYYVDHWIDAYELPNGLLYEEALGAALAKFHSASLGIVIPSDSVRYIYGKRNSFLLECSSTLQKWQNDKKLSHEFAAQMLEFLKHRCQVAYDYIKDIFHPESSILAAICHGSLHHQNILIDLQKNIWFIDFESLVYAERVLDLAQLIHYYAYPHDWNPAVVHRILSSYQAHHPAPLSRDEHMYFLSYLAFPRRLYNAMNECFAHRPKSRHGYVKLQKVIEQEWLKERFLSTFDPAIHY